QCGAIADSQNARDFVDRERQVHSVQLDEFSPNGTVLDTVTAFVEDAGDAITFSLDGMNLPFAIDEITGVLTVSDSSALDFNVPPQFQFDIVVTDRGGLEDRRTVYVNLNDLPDSVVLPIAGVKIASSAWTNASFLQTIDPQDSEGYLLNGSVAPQETISWSNLDRLLVKFSRDVASRIGGFEFVLNGVNTSSYDLVSTYDAATRTATLALNTTLDTDKLLLTITDPTNGLSQSIRFDVMPGDFSNNGIGSVIDLGPLRNALDTVVGDVAYSPFADADGSGSVTIDDANPLRNHIGIFLPDGEPSTATTNTSSTSSLQRVVTRTDVNLDGSVTALDALLVINQLNASNRNSAGLIVESIPQVFMDVNEDSRLSALDALQVINYLNQNEAADSEPEGEITEAEKVTPTSSKPISGISSQTVDAAIVEAAQSLSKKVRNADVDLNDDPFKSPAVTQPPTGAPMDEETLSSLVEDIDKQWHPIEPSALL
ncbi:MAG: dockerin type I domain-containing protein, partial [Planctomycetota bacterium]